MARNFTRGCTSTESSSHTPMDPLSLSINATVASVALVASKCSAAIQKLTKDISLIEGYHQIVLTRFKPSNSQGLTISPELSDLVISSISHSGSVLACIEKELNGLNAPDGEFVKLKALWKDRSLKVLLETDHRQDSTSAGLIVPTQPDSSLDQLYTDAALLRSGTGSPSISDAIFNSASTLSTTPKRLRKHSSSDIESLIDPEDGPPRPKRARTVVMDYGNDVQKSPHWILVPNTPPSYRESISTLPTYRESISETDWWYCNEPLRAQTMSTEAAIGAEHELSRDQRYIRADMESDSTGHSSPILESHSATPKGRQRDFLHPSESFNDSPTRRLSTNRRRAFNSLPTSRFGGALSSTAPMMRHDRSPRMTSTWSSRLQSQTKPIGIYEDPEEPSLERQSDNSPHAMEGIEHQQKVQPQRKTYNSAKLSTPDLTVVPPDAQNAQDVDFSRASAGIPRIGSSDSLSDASYATAPVSMPSDSQQETSRSDDMIMDIENEWPAHMPALSKFVNRTQHATGGTSRTFGMLRDVAGLDNSAWGAPYGHARRLNL